ncbi:astacin-like metalloprotease toxin 5 isoform X2 [Sander lucioperca]|uniref:astacin-like metalloprotease toxin 5 isoform X2 n=1 Tax=Sander lucioperca TaxID=283035 RepID=UPI00125E7E29|nr:astacin-like metalloprotease toxin 5 isoform X2 [Sander lucioperca]
MWLLIFVCVMTVVGGVPIHPTQEATSHAPVSVVPSNNTHVTTGSPATGVVTVVLGPQRHGAETLEELQGDMAVNEGDMLMSDDRNAVESIWPDAIVPYTISNELAQQESNILNAFKMISDVTCIRFIQCTTESNSLLITSGSGCSSYVGCQGGVQTLYYGKSCSLGNLCHEIIHALGLHHEHTREDRDQYISVQWQSIIPGRENNFMVKNGDTQNLPYDPESIMHYGQYFFSVDGSPTVLSRQKEVVIGQRTHLSNLDILKLNKLYGCEKGKHE